MITEEIEGSDEIKKLFEKILESPLNMEQNQIDVDKTLFIMIIEEIKNLDDNETIIFNNTGIDLSSITNNYLSVIEKLVMLKFGEKAYDIIMWYLFNRISPEGTILKLENQEGDVFEINNPEQLWEFINTKLK